MQFKGFYWLSCYGISRILQFSIRVCVIIRIVFILGFIFLNFAIFWGALFLVGCLLVWFVNDFWYS